MFDFGFTELLIIGAVALVVLGPERLPVVAKTAGKLFAQAQRYINQIKGEFDRETQLSEIKKLREEIASSASALKNSVNELTSDVDTQAKTISQSINEIQNEAKDAYSTFNRSEETFPEASAPAPVKSTGSVNPFGWKIPKAETEDTWQSQYIPRRYKSTASLDDVVEELQELRTQLALPRKQMSGNNRRWAPRSRVNRVRIHR